MTESTTRDEISFVAAKAVRVFEKATGQAATPMEAAVIAELTALVMMNIPPSEGKH
jgi:hypothetical protein